MLWFSYTLSLKPVSDTGLTQLYGFPSVFYSSGVSKSPVSLTPKGSSGFSLTRGLCSFASSNQAFAFKLPGQ